MPTLDEVPAPVASRGRAEVVVYSGVSFGASRKNRSQGTRSGAAGPVERLELFTDAGKPGQVFARVLILEEGSPVPREALITPMVVASRQDRQQLDEEYALQDLVERANVELSRFFNGAGPIDSDVKLREFKEFVKKQDSWGFLFSNLLHRNQEMSFDLFSAYFAPGGAMSGVGVFVNTWL